MRFHHSLDDVLRGNNHVHVLRVLDELPEGLAVSAREVGRRAGISHPTASRILASLAGQGMLLTRRAPRIDSYELNRDHVVTEKLAELFEWERRIRNEMWTFLEHTIRSQAPSVSSAYVFGSVAHEAETVESDVDLAVTCEDGFADVTEEDMTKVAEAFRARFGSRLNVLIGAGSLDRLSARRVGGNGVWKRIAEEGVRLIPTAEPVVG